MKAIFVGSLSEGFALDALVEDANVADKIHSDHVAYGRMSEVIEVVSPFNYDNKTEPFAGGANLIVTGESFASGITVIGPFKDDISATKFSETHFDDGVWSLFVLSNQAIEREISRQPVSRG